MAFEESLVDAAHHRFLHSDAGRGHRLPFDRRLATGERAFQLRLADQGEEGPHTLAAACDEHDGAEAGRRVRFAVRRIAFAFLNGEISVAGPMPLFASKWQKEGRQKNEVAKKHYLFPNVN
jgi:hypothetical protein